MTTPAAAALPMVRAHAEGQKAAKAGTPMSACPYDRNAESAVEQAKARMWLRGYDKIRPFPVDYSA